MPTIENISGSGRSSPLVQSPMPPNRTTSPARARDGGQPAPQPASLGASKAQGSIFAEAARNVSSLPVGAKTIMAGNNAASSVLVNPKLQSTFDKFSSLTGADCQKLGQTLREKGMAVIKISPDDRHAMLSALREKGEPNPQGVVLLNLKNGAAADPVFCDKLTEVAEKILAAVDDLPQDEAQKLKPRQMQLRDTPPRNATERWHHDNSNGVLNMVVTLTSNSPKTEYVDFAHSNFLKPNYRDLFNEVDELPGFDEAKHVQKMKDDEILLFFPADKLIDGKNMGLTHRAPATNENSERSIAVFRFEIANPT